MNERPFVAGSTERPWLAWAVVVAGLVLALPPLLLPVVPLQDFPAHCAATAIWQGGDATGLYEVVSGFGHSSLYYTLAGWLAAVSSAEWANRLLLALALGLLPAAAVAFARACARRAWAPLGVAVGVAWATPTAMGFLPWLLSMTAAFAAAAVVTRLASRVAALSAAAVAAVLLSGIHTFGAALFALLVVAASPNVLAAATRGGTALLAVAAVVLGARSAESPGAAPELGDPWERLLALPDYLGRATSGGPDAALALAVLLSLVLLAVQGRRSRVGAASPLLPAATLFLGLVCLVAPDFLDVPRIVHLATRFWPAAILLVAVWASAPVTADSGESPRRVEVSALVAGALLAGVSTIGASLDAEALAPIRQQLARLPMGPTTAVMTLNRPAPGSITLAFTGLHMPRYLDADGHARTIGPFFHADSPVRLVPHRATAVDWATRDTLEYVRRLSVDIPRFVGDFAEQGPIRAELTTLGYVECRGVLPLPWSVWVRPGIACAVPQ